MALRGGEKNKKNIEILKITFSAAKRLLHLLGHPFYLLIEALFVAILTVSSLRLTLPQLKLPKIKFPTPPHIRPVKIRISLPRVFLSPVFLTLSVLYAVGGIALISSFWVFIIRDIPRPTDLVQKPRPLTTRIYDRNGQLLFKIFRNQNRTYLRLPEIPLVVQQATIAIEDVEFYSHPGFSLRGILRATERNLRGQLTGGSTITQQLVKNALLTPERTIQRKLKEIVLAMWTEMTFSKDTILEMYLNEVSYGGTAYGIEEAAELYFGKTAKELSLGKAALLAGLTAAPTRFSPFGTNPEIARVRQQLVLARMVEEGFITLPQAKQAVEEPIVYAQKATEIKAPHFVMWVKQLLVERYGQRLVEEGGLEVTTSLDTSTQEYVENAVGSEVGNLARLNVTNGAAIVTRPQTGEVLAMVGSRNYFDQKGGNFNVTQAPRQPGSAIKPINYAFALSNGLSPGTLINDSPVSYDIPGQPLYVPKNYDNTFRGKVPLRVALGSSLNVPAVKVLASYGVPHMIEQGQKLGISTWGEPSRFGLSLTLGGGEVKMTDMAVVYGTFANYGEKVTLNPILRITDHQGEIIEEAKCKNNCGEPALDPRVAFLITNILSDNNARIPAFGPRSLLAIPDHPEVSVKTGTTQNMRDNWAVGYTKDYIVTTWVGNNDNTPMSRVASGVTGATPIWHNIMRYLLNRDLAVQQETPARISSQVRASEAYWETPAGVEKVKICSLTGTLPCEGCPIREEWFLEENAPTKHCVLPTPSPTP